MAYFAAVISLKNTIHWLLNSSQISILPPSREILEFALKEVGSVQKVLQNNEKIIIQKGDNERVTSLKGQITEAAYKLEDALESHALDQYESPANEVFLDFEEVKEEINYFAETMKKIGKMMMEELRRPLLEEEEVVPLKIDSGKKSKMVGLSKEFDELKDFLISGLDGCDLLVIVGMAGIGKTALAMKLFEDPSISSHFDIHVFVTIGPTYRLGFKKDKVMLSIADQINYDIDEIHMEDYANLAEYIRRSLQERRYLIVFDDIWEVPDLFMLLKLLPDDDILSRVLVTTRLEKVVASAGLWRKSDIFGSFYSMRFLNKEESWDLLCEKVFGERYLCPFQLEKFGKKIAEHCEGLPLAIVTVASILSNRDKTLDWWKKVAEKRTSVFADAYDQMSDVLISSYIYLPQYLKPYFLYMGVFPQSCKIRASNLTKLWHAEEILDWYSGKIRASNLTKLWRAEQILDCCSLRNIKDSARDCVQELVSHNIVIVDKRCSTRGVKTCKLHSAYWHLCVKEASKEKFLHAVNHYVRSFPESIKEQRRLCIHNNVLLGIKEVHKSMESILLVRSLLCTGPYLQYPVPICFCFRLLRVLDALNIRFYKFPIEVLNLVQLKYLALTYSGKVPGSISKLWNLEYLIVHRHLSINKSSRDLLYLPLEIWNMKELRHIQVMGGNLLDTCGAFLPNLLTLSDISVNSCSREIFERIPNLMKLGIQIELTPDAFEPLCCFGHISHLRSLESLKCVVVNPKPSSQVVASFTTLPLSLMKLSLSGLGYPWTYMRTIAKLPRLKVLKLRCYAFRGPVWETFDDEFLSLQYLLLEDTDLVHWRGNNISCFGSIRCLTIRHCYKLKEIPPLCGFYLEDATMEIVDCPSIGLSAEQLRKKYETDDIYVHSSLDDEK